MTYDDEIQKPQSKKITIVEIDAPLEGYKWINYDSGLWFTRLTPGSGDFTDDRGNTAYWDTRNDEYYNIQSLNVDGELYTEVVDLANLEATNKSWYYDESTTDFYIHFDSFEPPEVFGFIFPGAAIGFTHGTDTTVNNYFEDIYYNDLILSLPTLTKAKDPLFFGLIEFQGGQIGFDNTSGYFDDFASRDLYGQPVRIALGFEGLDIDDYEILYTGRVEDFSHDLTSFNLQVADQRKLLTRKYPINEFDSTVYPSMDSKYYGTPIPIAFGSIIKAPAYRTSSGNWKFCDTTFNAVDSGITVYDKDGNVYAHGGTETDGTFTATDTTENLTVSFNVSAVENGLDIIADLLENYEGITFNSFNYNTTEWNAVKPDIANSGIWLGKGKLKTSVQIIEQICVDNGGVFEVLSDGRYTFRLFDADRAVTKEIQQDEFMNDPAIDYDSDLYLTSVQVEHSEDLKEKEPQIFTNRDQETSIFGRYRQYKDQSFETTLTSSTDAETLSNRVLERSNFIYPIVTLNTKTQNSDLRILDIVTFTVERQNGNIIIPRSTWEVIGINLDLTGYENQIELRRVTEITGEDTKVIENMMTPDAEDMLTPSGEIMQTITRL